jgi:predicted house-cleaning noncanonical NTP pyrophosphatase (MazG superfamily)
MPEYHKLIRDNIPEIITANGMTAETRVLSDSEYELALIDKLAEEQKELANADTTEKMLEELADVQEVVNALADVIANRRVLEQVRSRKHDERGGFEKRIFLERTE